MLKGGSIPWSRDKLRGPWRDGSWLIIGRSGSKFPDFCVKTNRPAAGNQVVLNLELVQNRVIWVVLLGVLGNFIAKSTGRKAARIVVPVTYRFQRSCRWKRNSSYFLSLIGVAMLLGGLTEFYRHSFAWSGKHGLEWFGWMALAGAPLALGGAFFASVQKTMGLSLGDRTHECIWIDGATADFLDRLPKWSEREIAVGVPPGA
jgi:hypothetical protein